MTKRPAIFNGIMAGLVLLGIKLALGFTNNWTFRLTNYGMLSFLVIVIALILAGVMEKRRSKSVSYGKALLNGLITISIIVFLSLLGDQICYRSDPKLAVMTKDFQLEQGMKFAQYFPESMKEDYISRMEDIDPKDIYSIGAAIMSWLMYIVLNGVWMLLIALFTRKKADPFSDSVKE